MNLQSAEISDPSHHSSLMTSLRQFTTSNSFVDVQFVCQGGHKVLAHKLLLISVSKLLKQLLFENPGSNEMITIHLPDVNSKLLRIVINFLYIGSTRLNHNEMDQFKMLLKLLDIELCADSVKSDTPCEQSYPQCSSNLGNRDNASVQSNVMNTAAPVVNNVYVQRNMPTEFLPATQMHPIQQANMAVDRKPLQSQQYIKIQASELRASTNPGEVFVPVSAVPSIFGNSSLPNVQPRVSEENYPMFPSNVVTSSTIANNPNNVIPAPGMPTLKPQVQPIIQQEEMMSCDPPVLQSMSAATNCIQAPQPIQQQQIVNYSKASQNVPGVTYEQLPLSSTVPVDVTSVQQTSQQVQKSLSISVLPRQEVKTEGISDGADDTSHNSRLQKEKNTLKFPKLKSRLKKVKDTKRKCQRRKQIISTITEIIDLSEESTSSESNIQIVDVCSIENADKSKHKHRKKTNQSGPDSSSSANILENDDAVIEIDQ